MRLLAVSTIFLLGCAGKVAETGADAGGHGGADVGAGSDEGVAAPACPDSPPADGSPCSPDTYYCHYFDSTKSTCAFDTKCTTKSSDGYSFVAGAPCGAPVRAETCDEGQPCGAVFERLGRCVVRCTRGCSCNAATGLLHCAAITC